jgi:hypothetical protein
VRHHLLGEEPHRGERVIQRNHIEIDLQRGVFIAAEGVLRAAAIRALLIPLSQNGKSAT